MSVDLELDQEQAEIAATVVGSLDRVGLGVPLDADRWRRLAELGWFCLGIPAEHGGVGYGAAEEALLFVELGRRVVPGPFVGTVLAARLAASAGLEVARPLIEGEVGAALLDDGGRAYEHRAGDLGLLVRADGAVLYGAEAIRRTHALASMDPLTTIDAVDLAGEPICTWSGDAGAWIRALSLVAAYLTGVAQGALEQSVAHVSARAQFGQPIGAFQAVRHRCADMAIRVEASRSLTRFASLVVDAGGADEEFQVLSALTVARDASIANASANIQNHGAVGFTAEHPAHLFVKRARVLGAWLQGRPAQLDQLLEARAPSF